MTLIIIKTIYPVASYDISLKELQSVLKNW